MFKAGDYGLIGILGSSLGLPARLVLETEIEMCNWVVAIEIEKSGQWETV